MGAFAVVRAPSAHGAPGGWLWAVAVNCKRTAYDIDMNNSSQGVRRTFLLDRRVCCRGVTTGCHGSEWNVERTQSMTEKQKLEQR